MELPSISALRPKDTDSVSIRAAILAAEIARAEALDRAGRLERQMKAALLTATDAELEQAEREAGNSRRGADRIGALIAELRTALADAEAREAGDVEQARRAAVLAADAAFNAIWTKQYSLIEAAAAKVLAAARDHRRSQPRHRDARPPSLRDADSFEIVLELANRSAAEVYRRHEESAEEARRFAERRAAEQAERDRRVAAHALQERAERAEAERKQNELRIPIDNGRVAARITGGAGW